jgi:hypothetical protein
MSHSARILARAIRHGAQRHSERKGHPVSRAVITSLDPLALDLLGSDMTLGDDDVDFSQEVERYDASEGLNVGDTLTLMEVQEGDWIAVGVVSDTEVRPIPEGE